MSELEDNVAGINVPGESKEGSSLSPQINEQIVEKARQKGWAPLEDWRGNPEDWVDAREFLGREKLFDKIHGLQKEISYIKTAAQKDFQVIAQHFAQMRDMEYKRALAALTAERRAALREDNLERADELENQIDEIKEARLKTKETLPTNTQTAPDPTFEMWKRENSWFESDIDLQKEAIGLGVAYAGANPDKSQAEVLEYVSERIRKYNPEKFQSSRSRNEDEDFQGEEEKPKMKSSVESPSRGGSNGNRSGSLRKIKLSVNDLSDQERQVMTALVRRGTLAEIAKKNNRSQEAEYLAQLAEAKGL